MVFGAIWHLVQQEYMSSRQSQGELAWPSGRVAGSFPAVAAAATLTPSVTAVLLAQRCRTTVLPLHYPWEG